MKLLCIYLNIISSDKKKMQIKYLLRNNRRHLFPILNGNPLKSIEKGYRRKENDFYSAGVKAYLLLSNLIKGPQTFVK